MTTQCGPCSHDHRIWWDSYIIGEKQILKVQNVIKEGTVLSLGWLILRQSYLVGLTRSEWRMRTWSFKECGVVGGWWRGWKGEHTVFQVASWQKQKIWGKKRAWLVGLELHVAKGPEMQLERLAGARSYRVLLAMERSVGFVTCPRG